MLNHALALALGASTLLCPVLGAPTPDNLNARAAPSASSDFWALAAPPPSTAAPAPAPAPPQPQPSANPSAAAAAAPGPAAPPGGGALTGAQLAQIDPKIAADCSKAANGPHKAECRTASDAAPFIQQSFDDFGIAHPAVKAALISTMCFESGHLQYNTHIVPNGQGTRNMMMPKFIEEYGQYLKLTPPPNGNLSVPILASDKFSFGSAAWYLTQKCGDVSKSRQPMWGGKVDGFQKYVTDCLQAGSADMADRTTLWQAGLKVLGNQ
ncbi:MAG: hypothetical protein Q9162_007043 [Coniocarpon cinnabarinum]